MKVLLRFIWGLVRFEAVLIHVLCSTPNPSSRKRPPILKFYFFLLLQMYVPISLAPASSCLLIMLTKELKFYQISISLFHASIMSPQRDEFWYCLQQLKGLGMIRNLPGFCLPCANSGGLFVLLTATVHVQIICIFIVLYFMLLVIHEMNISFNN